MKLIRYAYIDHVAVMSLPRMDDQKVTESIRFLLSSVSKLSDHFLTSADSSRRSFDQVGKDIDELMKRLSHIEADLLNWRDQELVGEVAVASRPLELPIKAGQETMQIPVLNLSVDGILDVYRSTPVLLLPFARPCSVSGRTLSGLIPEVELEVFAQGNTWVIETQEGGWLILPRSGLLSRRSQFQSLGRLFNVEAEPELPAELELLEPGRAVAVEHGRRWYLADKGRLGIHTDPLQSSLENRLRRMESRLKALEDADD